jgi:hypothetical protein
MFGMQSTQDLKAPSIPNAWADLQAEPKMADWLTPEAHRLAFADPEFLLRRETRGIRFQLEMLKPDLAQTEAKIEHTVVVFGSARFLDPVGAQEQLQAARIQNTPRGVSRLVKPCCTSYLNPPFKTKGFPTQYRP